MMHRVREDRLARPSWKKRPAGREKWFELDARRLFH